MAIGGLITGILGLVIGAVIIFGAFALFSEVGEACGDLTGAEQEQCLARLFRSRRRNLTVDSYTIWSTRYGHYHSLQCSGQETPARLPRRCRGFHATGCP